jgi:hypothetical protein
VRRGSEAGTGRGKWWLAFRSGASAETEARVARGWTRCFAGSVVIALLGLADHTPRMHEPRHGSSVTAVWGCMVGATFLVAGSSSMVLVSQMLVLVVVHSRNSTSTWHRSRRPGTHRVMPFSANISEARETTVLGIE